MARAVLSRLQALLAFGFAGVSTSQTGLHTDLAALLVRFFAMFGALAADLFACRTNNCLDFFPIGGRTRQAHVVTGFANVAAIVFSLVLGDALFAGFSTGETGGFARILVFGCGFGGGIRETHSHGEQRQASD